MQGSPLRCVVILSSKSSGSSALQRLLCDGTNASHVERTRHAENETLYWTKAASILGLPQSRLHGSEVPIAPRKAKTDLITLLAQNVSTFVLPNDEQTLVFEGWRALCARYSPVFVEKSPHHLHQWSCLKLMADAAVRLPDIDFRFIGLVRNPMDTLYSAWSRWQFSPEKIQFEWLEAHQNLLRFKDLGGDRLTIVTYEALAAEGAAAALRSGLGIEGTSAGIPDLHSNSVMRWKTDKSYGFELDARVAALAASFGYTPDQLANRSSYRWKLKHLLRREFEVTWLRSARRMKQLLKNLARAPT